MNHDSRNSGDGELEQQMLEHYRRHATQEPSHALDAQILAAAQAHLDAQAQVRPRAPKPEPWLSRLHAWLFAGSPKGRWSVAVASLAVVGLGVGLSVRTYEQAPSAFDDAVPMMAPAAPIASEAVEPNAGYSTNSVPAPAPAPVQAYAKQAEKKRSVLYEEAEAAKTEQRKAAPMDISGRLADQAQPALAAPPAASAPAPFEKKAKQQVLAQQDEAQLQRGLQQILQLRQSGSPELAEQQLKTLQQLHPDRDLAAELRRLQGAGQ